jgi:ABC-type transport system substrate-binding protein
VAETGFDPAEISDLYSSYVVANIFDTPLTYDYLARPVKLIPNTLAAMPEVTENGTLITMKVKPGIYFQVPPGEEDVFKGQKRELTAHDYVYSIKRTFDPKKRSPNLYPPRGEHRRHGRGARKGAQGEQVRLRRAGGRPARARPVYVADPLKQPDYNFIYYLAFCNLTAPWRAKWRSNTATRTGEHPVGTGPFHAHLLEALVEDGARREPQLPRGVFQWHAGAGRRL